MPLFTKECSQALERAGIDARDASEDFDRGMDGPSTDPRQLYRYGRFGVYQYEPMIVFGRRDALVIHVWLGENMQGVGQ